MRWRSRPSSTGRSAFLWTQTQKPSTRSSSNVVNISGASSSSTSKTRPGWSGLRPRSAPVSDVFVFLATSTTESWQTCRPAKYFQACQNYTSTVIHLTTKLLPWCLRTGTNLHSHLILRFYSAKYNLVFSLNLSLLQMENSFLFVFDFISYLHNSIKKFINNLAHFFGRGWQAQKYFWVSRIIKKLITNKLITSKSKYGKVELWQIEIL